MSKPVPNGTISRQNIRTPVSVAGDTVYFSMNLGCVNTLSSVCLLVTLFLCRYDPNKWGLRATVTASVDKETLSMPWILDLERSIGLVCGKFCRLLIRGDVLSLQVFLCCLWCV